MNIDIPFWLLTASLIATIIILVDKFTWAKVRNQSEPSLQRPFVIEQAYQLLPVLFIVLILRSFVGQAFFVPSGSLLPTVNPGELLLVNQFTYGLRLPVWNTPLISVGDPKRGDIAVVYWPVNPSIHFVKRVVGVPGDIISYENKVLTVNGKVATQTPMPSASTKTAENGVDVERRIEDLAGVVHPIQVYPSRPSLSFHNLVVPSGQYFLMGDNRDDSDDSRYWGFVPRNQIIGKGVMIVLSWDSEKSWFRTDRTFTSLTSTK